MIETWKNDFRAFVKSLNLSRDDYKTMMEYIDEIPAVQPDHNADIGKKASISCGHENDLISRQVTINVVGDWIYDPEDLRYHKDVINSIPAVQPERKRGEVETTSCFAVSLFGVLCSKQERHRKLLPFMRCGYER